jgi:hypothetical protein
MKKVLLRLGALLMSFVVLFSTMSFTINSHYCGGTLFDTSFFNQVQNCGMNSDENQIQTTPNNGCSILKDNCCEDKQIAIEGQNELRLSIDNISLDQQLFVNTILHLSLECLDILTSQDSTQKYYRKQFSIAISIYKLNEAYLI